MRTPEKKERRMWGAVGCPGAPQAAPSLTVTDIWRNWGAPRGAQRRRGAQRVECGVVWPECGRSQRQERPPDIYKSTRETHTSRERLQSTTWHTGVATGQPQAGYRYSNTLFNKSVLLCESVLSTTVEIKEKMEFIWFKSSLQAFSPGPKQPHKDT